jgi:hypothetical protein
LEALAPHLAGCSGLALSRISNSENFRWQAQQSGLAFYSLIYLILIPEGWRVREIAQTALPMPPL